MEWRGERGGRGGARERGEAIRGDTEANKKARE
jgi:hypothetical protein